MTNSMYTFLSTQTFMSSRHQPVGRVIILVAETIYSRSYTECVSRAVVGRLFFPLIMAKRKLSIAICGPLCGETNDFFFIKFVRRITLAREIFFTNNYQGIFHKLSGNILEGSWTQILYGIWHLQFPEQNNRKLKFCKHCILYIILYYICMFYITVLKR